MIPGDGASDVGTCHMRAEENKECELHCLGMIVFYQLILHWLKCTGSRTC